MRNRNWIVLIVPRQSTKIRPKPKMGRSAESGEMDQSQQCECPFWKHNVTQKASDTKACSLKRVKKTCSENAWKINLSDEGRCVEFVEKNKNKMETIG